MNEAMKSKLILIIVTLLVLVGCSNSVTIQPESTKTPTISETVPHSSSPTTLDSNEPSHSAVTTWRLSAFSNPRFNGSRYLVSAIQKLDNPFTLKFNEETIEISGSCGGYEIAYEINEEALTIDAFEKNMEDLGICQGTKLMVWEREYLDALSSAVSFQQSDDELFVNCGESCLLEFERMTEANKITLAPTTKPCTTLIPSEIWFDMTVLPNQTDGTVEVIFSGTHTIYRNEILLWEWYFGDGTTALNQNTSHKYTSQEDYRVNLRTHDCTGWWNQVSRILFLKPPRGEIVSFPDPNLEEVVRDYLGMPDGDIYQSHLEEIVKLIAWDIPTDLIECWPINDFSGAENCINLESIEICCQEIDSISSLTKLAHLPRLAKLSISDSQINDISPLSSLTNLTELNLFRNDIVDISPLSDLTNLTELDLSYNRIVDISHLSDLIKLSELDLSVNNIVDVSPLLDNTGLGEGDIIDLQVNPLSKESKTIIIPQLKERGVEVTFNW